MKRPETLLALVSNRHPLQVGSLPPRPFAHSMLDEPNIFQNSTSNSWKTTLQLKKAAWKAWPLLLKLRRKKKNPDAVFDGLGGIKLVSRLLSPLMLVSPATLFLHLPPLQLHGENPLRLHMDKEGEGRS